MTNTKRSFPAVIYILILLFFATLFYLIIEGLDFIVTSEGDRESSQIFDLMPPSSSNTPVQSEIIERVITIDRSSRRGVFLTGIFVLLAAFIALLGVSLTALLTSRNNNKNIFINMVTRERAKWREELRRDTSEFYSLAYPYEHPKVIDKIDNITRLQKLKVLIKLRLNPDPTHKLDQSIMYDIDSIIENITSKNDNKEIMIQLTSLENNVQKLLKQEWEKTKEEARVGNIREGI